MWRYMCKMWRYRCKMWRYLCNVWRFLCLMNQGIEAPGRSLKKKTTGLRKEDNIGRRACKENKSKDSLANKLKVLEKKTTLDDASRKTLRSDQEDYNSQTGLQKTTSRTVKCLSLRLHIDSNVRGQGTPETSVQCNSDCLQSRNLFI